MKEQLISFETAKLAKEKGFNIPCKYFYKEKYTNAIEYEVVHDGHLEANWNENFKYSPAECSAPTQSLLQKWLREKYHLIIIVAYQYEHDLTPYSYWIYKENNSLPINQWVNDLNTYEEALELGLQEALKSI